jgi:autotransporter-associated beta strand protein
VASGRHGPWLRARWTAALLATTCLTWAAPALAGGGQGGGGGGAGGADSLSGPGNPGSGGVAGGGGGAGATGGQGGSDGVTTGGNGGQTPGGNGDPGLLGTGGGGGAHGAVVSSTSSIGALTGGAGGSGGNFSIGGGGGAGAYGAAVTGTVVISTAGAITGGAGGAGGGLGAGTLGGGGGSGGIGIAFGASGATLSNSNSITGGAGGAGGGDSSGTLGGSGGAGGAGVTGSGITITNVATIKGGNGGGGGIAATESGNFGGVGGAGGAGISGSSLTITNSSGATIQGANGGAGGAGFTPGVAGAGGAAIAGSDLSITNNGTITAGSAGGGGPQANAITFIGGLNNVLQLQSGSVITGNVVTAAGSSKLQLGGSTDASFNVSQIGSGAQYQGFSSFEKTGTSKWTLTNTTAATTSWAINGGTLSISSDSNLGAAGGALTFNGGTLQVTTAINSSRGITLLSGGGTIDSSVTTTLSGNINGNGGLTLAPSSTVVLTNSNGYTGGTTIGTAATLQLGSGGSLASTGAVAVNGGTFDINGHTQTIGALSATGGTIALGSGALTAGDGTNTAVAADISGSGGSFTKQGAGTMTLSGTNSYTGATTIAAGTLALSGGSSLFSSSGLTVNFGAFFDISGVSTPTTAVKRLSGGGAVNMGGHGLVITNAATEFSGVIAGSGGVEIVRGTQTLSGFNVYTNATQIDQGATLAIKGTGSIAGSAVVTFAPFAPGVATLDISQTNVGTAVAGLFDSTGIGVVALGGKTLTITNGSSFGGVIQDGGIAGGTGGSLVISAPGLGQDLSGVNTYTGSTTITAGGLLTLTGNGSIASSSGLTLAGVGAQFDISAANGNVTIKDLSGVAGSSIQLGSNFLTVGTANSTTFAGVLDDSSNPGGGLIKQGTGTLTLTASNTFSGGTTVNAGLINFNSAGNFGTGTITLNGGGLQWASGTTTDISSRLAPLGAGGGIFDTNGNNVTLGSAISGTGGLTKQGLGTLTLTANNLYSGGTTVTGGLINFSSASNFGSGLITLNGGGLQWASGSTADISSKLAPLGASGGTFDTNGNNITFASGLTGTGGLTKQGAGLLNLTGTNTYTGPTSVTAGTLSVNGSVTSNVSVGSAGTLGGNGTIFGNVTNAGMIAPGNSIGTLNINGNFTQAAGSIYQVEINAAGQGDRINVSGTATIQGGTVQVQAQPGNYISGTTYTILRANAGVSGTYSGITSNFAFLNPALAYDANDVFLILALQGSTPFSGFTGLTPNQKATAFALDQSFASATGDYATVINALAGLSVFQGPQALNVISGEQYADFGTMNVNNSAMFMNAIGQQMAISRGASAGQRQALAQACDITACDATGPWSVWASALGGLGNVTGDFNASSASYNFGGGAAGVDYRFDPRFLLGIGAGYTAGSLWVNNFLGKGTSDSVAVAAYGSFTWGGFYADVLGGYAYFNNQLQRQILIPGLQPRTANGSTGGNQGLGQVETGYKLPVFAPAAATITPFARLQGSSVTQNAFTEWGAQSLNLNVQQQTTNSLRTVFGADLAGSIALGNTRTLDLDVRLGWQHEFATTARPITAALSGAPFNAFTVYGATPQPDSAIVSLQAKTYVADATQLYLRYDGDIGSGTDNHTLNLGVRFMW